MNNQPHDGSTSPRRANERDPLGKFPDKSKFAQMVRPRILGARDGSTGTAKQDKSQKHASQTKNKIESLKALMRPKSRMYRERLPRTLEFGHEFTTSYKKHNSAGGQVKNIFFNRNIRSYVSYNEKQLHIWREDDGQQVMNISFFDATQSHSISCIVYSETHMLYLAISTDFKMHIFNEHLVLIGWLPLKVRLVNFAFFSEETSMLITGGIDGCFMFKFNFTSKYEPKQAVLFDPEGKSFQAELGPKIKLEKMPLWIKGLKVNLKQNIIFSWSQLKACFNDLNGKILNRYKKLTNYEDYITDILISDKYRYFVTSTYTGNIIVWKRKKNKQLIHTFTSHTKCVTSLQELPDQPTLFMSASNDNTIRIFSLDKFSELYSFILPAGVTNVSLLNDRIFACFYNDCINIGKLHHLALSFHSAKVDIKKIKRIIQNKPKSSNDSNQDTIMTLFSDNSIQLQLSDSANPVTLSTIYPPPGAKDVMFMGYCMNKDRVFILLTTGTLCIYRFDEGQTAILEKLMHSNEIKDIMQRSLSQSITAVTFCQTIPPKFDCEFFNESSITNTKQLDQAYKEQKDKYPEHMTDRFLVFGLSKGSVIFLDIDKIDTIYARFFFHRQAITSILEIPKHEKFITICEEMNIAIWGFNNYTSYKVSYNQMYRQINSIERLGDNVIMAFKSGDQQLFKFMWDQETEDQNLFYLKTDVTFEHEKEVSDLSAFEEQNIFASGSTDGFVKIWSMKKTLLREIKFPEAVYSVAFMNDQGDLLVGHHGKVSMVAFKDYQPDEIQSQFKPKEEDLKNFYEKKSKLADSECYLALKQKDDEIKRQNMILLNKPVPSKKITQIQIAQPTYKTPILKNKLRGSKQPNLNKSKESNVLINDMEVGSQSSKSVESDSSYSEDEKNSIATSPEPDYDGSQHSGDEKNTLLNKQSRSISKESSEERFGTNIKASSSLLLDSKKHSATGSQYGLSSVIKNKSLSKKTTPGRPIQPNLQNKNSSRFQQSMSQKPLDRSNVKGIELPTSIAQGTQQGENLSENASSPRRTEIKIDIEEVKRTNQKQIDQLESHAITAIPNHVMQHNYEMALQKLTHGGKNKIKLTRRDITLERIKGNIYLHNNPLGKQQKFETLLLGKQQHINNVSLMESRGKPSARPEYENTKDIKEVDTQNSSFTRTGPKEASFNFSGMNSHRSKETGIQHLKNTNLTASNKRPDADVPVNDPTYSYKDHTTREEGADQTVITAKKIDNLQSTGELKPNTQYMSRSQTSMGDEQGKAGVKSTSQLKVGDKQKQSLLDANRKAINQSLPQIQERQAFEQAKDESIQSYSNDGFAQAKPEDNDHLPQVLTSSQINTAEMANMQAEISAYKKRADINEFLYPKYRNVSLNQVPIQRNLIAKKNQNFHLQTTQKAPQKNQFLNRVRSTPQKLDEQLYQNSSAYLSVVAGMGYGPNTQSNQQLQKLIMQNRITHQGNIKGISTSSKMDSIQSHILEEAEKDGQNATSNNKTEMQTIDTLLHTQRKDAHTEGGRYNSLQQLHDKSFRAHLISPLQAQSYEESLYKLHKNRDISRIIETAQHASSQIQMKYTGGAMHPQAKNSGSLSSLVNSNLKSNPKLDNTFAGNLPPDESFQRQQHFSLLNTAHPYKQFRKPVFPNKQRGDPLAYDEDKFSQHSIPFKQGPTYKDKSWSNKYSSNINVHSKKLPPNQNMKVSKQTVVNARENLSALQLKKRAISPRQFKVADLSQKPGTTQQQLKISSLQATRLMALGQNQHEGTAMQIYGQRSNIQHAGDGHNNRSMNLQTIPDDLLDNNNSSTFNKDHTTHSNKNSIVDDDPSVGPKNINKEIGNTRNLKRFDTSVNTAHSMGTQNIGSQK